MVLWPRRSSDLTPVEPSEGYTNSLLENRQHAGQALAFEEDKTMQHIPSAGGNRYKLPGRGVP